MRLSVSALNSRIILTSSSSTGSSTLTFFFSFLTFLAWGGFCSASTAHTKQKCSCLHPVMLKILPSCTSIASASGGWWALLSCPLLSLSWRSLTVKREVTSCTILLRGPGIVYEQVMEKLISYSKDYTTQQDIRTKTEMHSCTLACIT